MTDKRAVVDSCTPALDSIAISKSGDGDRGNGSLNGVGERVAYTLKPATRAYASTARYIETLTEETIRCQDDRKRKHMPTPMNRLNLQHYLWKDQTGYLLHPSIPLSEIENPKIADVGTGTGYVHRRLCPIRGRRGSDQKYAYIPMTCILCCHSMKKGQFLSSRQIHRSDYPHPHRIWLLDIARTLPPTAQLDGFDIDVSDCPHEQWLPPNVTMRQLDALGEIPEHLVGVYDIVHLRLFQVVVKDNDPGPLLRNILRLLSGCTSLLVRIRPIAFILFIYAPSELSHSRRIVLFLIF